MQILSFLQMSRAAEGRGRQEPGGRALRDHRTGLYHAEYFNELLTLEKRRCERSRDSVLLMCVNLKALGNVSDRHKIAAALMRIFSRVTRETDIKGWYVSDAVVGIMFTRLMEQGEKCKTTVQLIINKCSDSLRVSSDLERLSKTDITWHVYPEEFLGASVDPLSGGRRAQAKERHAGRGICRSGRNAS